MQSRLRVVPHFFLRDSRASETRPRVKITPREKRRHTAGRLLYNSYITVFRSPRRVSPFLACGDFHARLRFARSTIPEEIWGTTRSLNKFGRPRSGSPICLITSMVTDRIGRHEVLLPINHNFNKICDIIGYF